MAKEDEMEVKKVTREEFAEMYPDNDRKALEGERDALAVHVAELETILANCRTTLLYGRDTTDDGYLHAQAALRVTAIEAALAKPAPRAELVHAALRLADEIHERCEDGLIMNNPGFVNAYAPYRAAKEAK